MDKEKFFSNLQDTFAFQHAEAFDSNALFKEHRNWGSVTSLLTIAMFFSDYDVHIEGDDLVACDTFQDLYDLIAKKVGMQCTA